MNEIISRVKTGGQPAIEEMSRQVFAPLSKPKATHLIWIIAVIIVIIAIYFWWWRHRTFNARKKNHREFQKSPYV